MDLQQTERWDERIKFDISPLQAFLNPPLMLVFRVCAFIPLVGLTIARNPPSKDEWFGVCTCYAVALCWQVWMWFFGWGCTRRGLWVEFSESGFSTNYGLRCYPVNGARYKDISAVWQGLCGVVLIKHVSGLVYVFPKHVVADHVLFEIRKCSLRERLR